MSLRSKIAWIVFVAVSLFIGGSYALTRFTFEGRVAEFDEERARATMERILAVLDSRIEVQDRPDAREAPTAVDSIRYDGVSHEYTAGVPALDSVDLEFHRGELTGVFGASGAGKSTLASLAVRLFDPSSGTVSLNGTDLRDLTVASLRDRVGMCLQENILFGETVAENLALGAPDSTAEEQWEALRSAGADGFVNELEEGLETVLGSQGKGLSGGQRRRLVLGEVVQAGFHDHLVAVSDTESDALRLLVDLSLHRISLIGLRVVERTTNHAVLINSQLNRPRRLDILFVGRHGEGA